MAAFVEELGDRATVLRGRCLPYGEGITFYPLAEALIEIADLHEADTPEAARAKLAALAGSEGDAGRIAELVGQAIGIAGESAPEETFWAIRTLLEHLAADRPLVFAIDDLQWAEPKFLELIEHVADFARDAPILLACMARPELLDDHPGWAGGKLNATSILVEPLGPEECGMLVANLLADDSVDAGGPHADRGGGRRTPALRGGDHRAPGRRGAARAEGGPMGRDGRPVRRPGPADDLGVAGRPAGPAARRRTTAARHRLGDGADLLPRRGACACRSDGDDVGAGIGALVRRQFIRRERSDLPETDAMAFRHLLIRDAAYDAVPKTRARRAARAVRRVAGRGGGSLGEQDEIVGLPPRAGVPLPGSSWERSGERERQLADAAGRRLAAAGEQAIARSDHHGVDQPPLSGVVRCSLPTTRCGSASCRTSGRRSTRPAIRMARRAIFDEAVERAAAAGDDADAHARRHQAMVLVCR